MNTSAICKDDQRREAVRRKTGLNGLDYLEVGPDQSTLIVYFLGKAPDQFEKQATETPEEQARRLRGYFRIEGGRRIRDIQVTKVEVQRAGRADEDDSLILHLDKPGDFSIYTLRAVAAEHDLPSGIQPLNFDPRYDQIDFTFKVDCPSDLDCLPEDTCPPSPLDEPEINYLAKDYASFRQLILDRLALILPDWKERHIPDIGITLVELLAYAGDYLSYYQDAVATEAYLETARQRISVRRHARLMDHHIHEGCNARAWVCIETDSDFTRAGNNAIDPRSVFFITRTDNPLMSAPVLTQDMMRQIPLHQYEAFEPMANEPIELYCIHSEMDFYTWGMRECCLPRGATSATLLYNWKQFVPEAGSTGGLDMESIKAKLPLKEGAVLIFEEIWGPKTGVAEDADPSHRHAVRLTRITPGQDPLNDELILEIEWSQDDALPFPVCISAITDASHGCKSIEKVSVARGNVILVDHGLTYPHEDLGTVPCLSAQAECDCADHPAETSFLPGRFRPKIASQPLTFRQPIPLDDPKTRRMVPAKGWLLQDVRAAVPQITLSSTPPAPAADCEHAAPLFRLADLLNPTSLALSLRRGSNPVAVALRPRLSKETLDLLDQPSTDDTIPVILQQALIAELNRMLLPWSIKYDLLNSGPDDRHFVVEIDNDGYAHLRFGNGELGSLPRAGTSFFATYRVGRGIAGNVGAETISRMVFRGSVPGGVQLSVRNPLPAQGGTEPEPMAEVKLFAPFAYRKEMQRAVTAEDYARVVMSQGAIKDQLQSAAATLTWTGSWYEAQVVVDPFRSEEAEPQFLDALQERLYPYRRIGHDVRVTPAQYVPLDVEISVCVQSGYLRGHVEAALLDVFSNRLLPDGRLGFFHPDHLTFGGGIYLSKLVAAAQAVTGVESVKVTKLQRLYEGDSGELDAGVLHLRALEIARLDNDPSFPEHGKLKLDIRGGR